MPATKKKQERINFNVSMEDKIKLTHLAAESGLTMTDFILSKCFGTETGPGQEILQLEKRHLQEKLERAEADLRKADQNLKDLQSRFDTTYQALLFHTLPWYKKMGKRLELPNK